VLFNLIGAVWVISLFPWYSRFGGLDHPERARDRPDGHDSSRLPNPAEYAAVITAASR
jgi:hypothetical protein